LNILNRDITPLRKPLPNIQRLLGLFRRLEFPIYHTREGHRGDLSTLPPREYWRSRNNPNGIGIGDEGPLGRLLIRGSKGWEIIPELTPLDNEPIVDKPTKGAFTYTDFDLLLRNKAIRNLILCGVCTDICVHTTMREAADRGYDCLLVSDACGATVDAFHVASIGMTHTEGGIFGATCDTQDVINVLESM
jgi:nicotinamidase-related amidase